MRMAALFTSITSRLTVFDVLAASLMLMALKALYAFCQTASAGALAAVTILSARALTAFAHARVRDKAVSRAIAHRLTVAVYVAKPVFVMYEIVHADSTMKSFFPLQIAPPVYIGLTLSNTIDQISWSGSYWFPFGNNFICAILLAMLRQKSRSNAALTDTLAVTALDSCALVLAMVLAPASLFKLGFRGHGGVTTASSASTSGAGHASTATEQETSQFSLPQNRCNAPGTSNKTRLNDVLASNQHDNNATRLESLSRQFVKRRHVARHEVQAEIDKLREPYHPISGGHRTTVVMKVNGHVHTHDLKREFAEAMRAALANIGMSRYQVIDMAIRPGCVIITLDLNRCIQQSAVQPAVDASDRLSSADERQRLVNAMLSVLQPVLEQKRKSGSVAHGEVVTCQVDEVRLEATWSQETQLWGIKESEIVLPESAMFGYITQVGVDKDVRNTSAVTAPGSFQHTQHSRAALLHAQFEAQLLLPSTEFGKTMMLSGYEPPQHTQHEELQRSTVDQDLSVLVRCQGVYLRTSVRLLAGTGRLRSAQIGADIPDACLIRHHEGGSAVGILPMTFELVQGHTLLSSAPVVTSLSSTPFHSIGNHHADASASEASYSNGLTTRATTTTTTTDSEGARVWWWGTSPQSVMKALNMYHNVNHVLYLESQESEDLSAVHTWHGFTRDLCMWLESVRTIAVNTGQCLARPTGPRQHTALGTGYEPPLLQDQMADVYGDLNRYCIKARMYDVSRMLTEQADALGLKPGTWFQNTSATRLNGNVPTTRRSTRSLTGLMRASWFGWRCHECEAQYRRRLGVVLSGAQPWASLMFMFIGCAGVGKMVAQNGAIMKSIRSGNVMWVTSLMPWLLSHSACFFWVTHWKLRQIVSLNSAHHSWHATGSHSKDEMDGEGRAMHMFISVCARFMLLALVCRLAYKGTAALNLVPAFHGYRTAMTSPLYYAGASLISLTELMFVQLAMPPVFAGMPSVVEALVNLGMSRRPGPERCSLIQAGVLTACMIFPRMLMDMRLRRVLCFSHQARGTSMADREKRD